MNRRYPPFPKPIGYAPPPRCVTVYATLTGTVAIHANPSQRTYTVTAQEALDLAEDLIRAAPQAARREAEAWRALDAHWGTITPTGGDNT